MSEELWGPIDQEKWQDTPYLSGRSATEADVASGFAVFYIPPTDDMVPLPVAYNLPRCAIQTMDEGGTAPVIVIQAEKFDGVTYLGVRYLDGGNGLCSEAELEFLDEPNDLFV